MTKEDKELLLKDLCARLPYCIKGKTLGSKTCTLSFIGNDGSITADTYHCWLSSNQFIPYLRPMSSMTKQECIQLNILLPRYFIVTPDHLNCLEHVNGGIINFEVLDTIIDFYNSHHLDWRGLIPKGLALEAPKGMYKI